MFQFLWCSMFTFQKKHVLSSPGMSLLEEEVSVYGEFITFF